MIEPDQDWLARLVVFRFLEELVERHGDAVPWEPLQHGCDFGGTRITLIGARGIWKPKGMSLPLSISTSPKDPYGDFSGDDGLLHYRYFGHDPAHPDNSGLRRCMAEGRPLVYFRGVEAGWYVPVWPMVLVHDDPGALTFVGACEDVETLRPGIQPAAADDARRRYVTHLAVARLHQAGFRQRVLSAYRHHCSVCRLRHTELLDAAHILPDRSERGEPVVPNGLSLCKIHHAAFDRNILGVRPDYVIEIRSDVLAEVDGPMLRHGLQDLHRANLAVLPRRTQDQPDPARLEERYERFRAAG